MGALAAISLLVGMYINMTAMNDERMALRDLGVVCVALNIANFIAPLSGLVRADAGGAHVRNTV